MTDLQTAYILHTRPYRETSLLLELLTADKGRLTLVARGIRKHKLRRGLTIPFQKLQVGFGGRGELRNLTHVEAAGPPVAITQLPLFCAYYVNELMLKLLAPGDECKALFCHYESVINQLASLANGNRDDLEVCLREFEFLLLQEMGKLPEFAIVSDNNHRVEPDRHYWVTFDHGICSFKTEDSVNIQGHLLLAIARKDWHPQALAGAKKIIRFYLQRLLNDKPLHSRKMIQDYIGVMSEQ